MAAVRVFVDEAGYTGGDLVNREQPVFVLASTILEDNHARELVERLLPQCASRGELKHSRLSRVKRYRAEIVAFVRELPRDQVGYFVAHKEFVLFALLVDYWLETAVHRRGINFYERGQNIAYCNMAFTVMTAVMGVNERRELLRRFQVLMRDRTRFAYDNFWETVAHAARSHRLLDEALGYLLTAEAELGPSVLNNIPGDVLDLGDYFVLDTVTHWRQQQPDQRLDIFHDQSKLIQRHREQWERILFAECPPTTVGQDRRTIEFPLPVDRLALCDSTEHLQLQIADILAGAATTVMRTRAGGPSTDYAEALVEAGLIRMGSGGIWPTTAIAPADLDTDGPALEDAAGFVGRLMSGGSREGP